MIGYPQARTQAALFDVSDRGKVLVSGREARAFLHNLCTNDIRNLSVGASCEAFFCTAQARVVARVLIYCLPPEGGDRFLLDTDPGQAAKVLGHLDHFLISEQVEFVEETEALAQFHLAGPEAAAVLERGLLQKLPDLAELHHARATFGTTPVGIRRHRPLALPGYDVLIARDQASPLRETLLQAGAQPADGEAYEVLRIEAGTPLYGVDVDETRLVMDVNRTSQAISYTKGCYLGQEPIVMARDRGHVNRALLGLKIAGPAPVPAGSQLQRDGKDVGQVTSSTFSPGIGSAIALAYLRRGNWEAGTAVAIVAGSEKRTAEVVSLPFSVVGSS